jgi:hypothetical protein
MFCLMHSFVGMGRIGPLEFLKSFFIFYPPLHSTPYFSTFFPPFLFLHPHLFSKGAVYSERYLWVNYKISNVWTNNGEEGLHVSTTGLRTGLEQSRSFGSGSPEQLEMSFQLCCLYRPLLMSVIAFEKEKSKPMKWESANCVLNSLPGRFLGSSFYFSGSWRMLASQTTRCQVWVKCVWVILGTQDGENAEQYEHPSSYVPKVYTSLAVQLSDFVNIELKFKL